MLRLKSLFCLDDLFYFRVVISLSCPIQCCFVALHDYDRYALWLVATQSLLAFVSTKRNSACASKLPFKPVIPCESTIPTGICLPSLTKTFMYYLKTLFKNF